MAGVENQLPRRKAIRLPAECYTGGDHFLVTICTEGREQRLHGQVRSTVVRFLVKDSADNDGPVFGWVVMPDHVHVLLAGSRDAVRWVQTFKAAVTSSLRKKKLDIAWQRSFHDRGIRRNENLEFVGRYMLENPVRAGLCNRFDDWPWSYVAGMKEAGVKDE